MYHRSPEFAMLVARQGAGACHCARGRDHDDIAQQEAKSASAEVLTGFDGQCPAGS